MGNERRAFTLIELLVVMLIISMLASLLLVGITAARVAAKKGQCQVQINQLLLAITEYYNQLGQYPPSGEDTNDDGKLSDSTGKMSSEAWPPTTEYDPAIHASKQTDPSKHQNEHPLIAYLTETQEIRDLSGNTVLRRFEAPYPKATTKAVLDQSGGSRKYIVDPYGNPYRYLKDGRRRDRGEPARVTRAEPILWSAGADGKEDPENGKNSNGDWDSNDDGKADDQQEMIDDVCSWW